MILLAVAAIPEAVELRRDIAKEAALRGLGLPLKHS
jgi:hypothetical protein